MKVIFLDHDGIICLSDTWGSRSLKQKAWGGRKFSMTYREVPINYRFDDFNKKAVEVLNEILAETGAEIVVSSDWRHHGSLEELQEYYKQQGIIKTPISMTKSLPEINRDLWLWKFRFYARLEEERAIEIKTWIDEHPNITSWVAVDDLNMSKLQKQDDEELEMDWGLDNFVWVKSDDNGIADLGVKEKIITFLK